MITKLTLFACPFHAFAEAMDIVDRHVRECTFFPNDL